MSKEELIAFLKENLKIQITVAKRYGNYGAEGVRVEAELVINGEVISTSEDHVFLD